MTKKTGRGRKTAKQPTFPVRQRDLPAGYHKQGGHLASLVDVADPRTPTIDGSQLTPEQHKHLTLERIRRQRDVQFGTLDGGVVDKERALREVQEETPLGKTLLEIERRTIAMIREYALRGTVAPTTRPGQPKTPLSAPKPRSVKRRASVRATTNKRKRKTARRAKRR